MMGVRMARRRREIFKDLQLKTVLKTTFSEGFQVRFLKIFRPSAEILAFHGLNPPLFQDVR